MDKIGAWPAQPVRVAGPATSEDIPEPREPEPPPGLPQWNLTVFIRNSSELPVVVVALELSVRPWGYNRLPRKEGTQVSWYADKRFGLPGRVPIAPGTVAPGQTWSREITYTAPSRYDEPQPPFVYVARTVVTDAAGRQWEISPHRTGPARRVRWWLRKRWERRGDV